jgi:hypothetical protein
MFMGNFRGAILVLSALSLTACNDPVNGYFAAIALPSPGPSSPNAVTPQPVVSPVPTNPPAPGPTTTATPTSSPTHSASPSPTASASASPSPSPSPSPTPSPSIIGCNPFTTPSGSPSGSPDDGLLASLYYLPGDPGAPNDDSVAYYIQTGTYVGDFLFSQVNIPTENFLAGFPMSNGKLVMDKNGDVLNQWFALDFKASIVLGATDAPGLYEIAVLSDDGSILYLDQGMGQGLQPAIENDGEHSNRIVCSSVAYNFSNSATNPTIMPMELKYFQGPKESIAAQIFWRKVTSSSASSLADTECASPSTSTDPLGGLDDNYYYDTDTNSTPQTPIENFISRGWHVLAPDNFLLPGGVVNKCPAPIPSSSPSPSST